MKRRFFQIHLLTAVVGMLTFGGFIGLNLKVRSFNAIKIDYVRNKETGVVVVRGVYHIGWPADIAYIVPVNSKHEIHASEVDVRKLLGPGHTGSLAGKPVWTFEDVQRVAPAIVEKMGWSVHLPESDWYLKERLQKRGIAINAIVAFSATLTVMFGVEWLLRRREAVTK